MWVSNSKYPTCGCCQEGVMAGRSGLAVGISWFSLAIELMIIERTNTQHNIKNSYKEQIGAKYTMPLS